ncbi:hypothetical protein FPQ18DRAFT_307716 [Pyronema domesticum]|nr:hypothetical protein FPQ18DRAFT_307716 [Pyronema domesticum]
MTTQALSDAAAATSYAAALTSGTITKSSGIKAEGSSTSGTNKPATNGVIESVTEVPTAQAKPADESTSALEDQTQETPAVVNTVLENETTEEQSNGWERSSQQSSGADTTQSNESGAQPVVNFWVKRQEELTAKPKNVSQSTTPLPASKSEKTQNFGKKVDDRSKDSDSAKDYRKSGDEPPSKRTSRRGQSNENDASSLPPPVSDMTSWPTPDLAQGEFKKEKEDKEKVKEEKPATAGRSKTWLPVAIDTPYAPPIQAKTGRGGRRGGREGGRGGALGAHGDRSEKAGAGASGAPESERGRQYSGSRFQGGKGPKRSSSTGTPAQRRESKTGTANGTTERRKDSSDALDGRAERPKATNGGDEASEVRQNGDGQKHQVNGHGNQSRPDRSNGWVTEGSEPTTSFTQRERGQERIRGGYRARSNFHGQYSNSHGAAHLQPQQLSAQANGQQFIQYQQPRGGSFGRRGGHAAYGAHTYRFNPAMQHAAQFMAYGTSGSAYDYSMVAPNHGVDNVNYYFSVDNLCKDIYLRKQMDNDGYVRLSVIAGFRKIQETTKDINILRDAAMMSHEINVQYGFDDVYLRKKDGWQSFVLKEEERDESAKREQINCYIDPRQQKANPNFMTQPSEMIGSTETLFLGSQSHIPPTPTYFPPTTQYGYPLPASGLSATVPEFAPSQSQAPMYGYPGPSASTDEYPDSEIDTLMVVVKRPVSGENASVTENASQTSNGVTEATNLGEQDGDGAYDEARRRPQLNGSSSHRSHTSRSEITWSKIEASVTAANATPSPNMSHLSYTEVRAQALQNRNSSSPSKSSREMTILYRFWSHFLVQSFNSSMYKEFRQFALDDADHSVRRGIEELFKFYERSLSQRATVSWDIINDFVELVKADARHGENHGVDRLKAIINQQVQTPYKDAIRALIDHDLNQVLTHGVGKKNSRSPAAEPYKAIIA